GRAYSSITIEVRPEAFETRDECSAVFAQLVRSGAAAGGAPSSTAGGGNTAFEVGGAGALTGLRGAGARRCPAAVA
ncbi:MAG: hypothetical protein Q9203_006949, partial [Teloschistes exilis]